MNAFWSRKFHIFYVIRTSKVKIMGFFSLFALWSQKFQLFYLLSFLKLKFTDFVGLTTFFWFYFNVTSFTIFPNDFPINFMVSSHLFLFSTNSTKFYSIVALVAFINYARSSNKTDLMVIIELVIGIEASVFLLISLTVTYVFREHIRKAVELFKQRCYPQPNWDS